MISYVCICRWVFWKARSKIFDANDKDQWKRRIMCAHKSNRILFLFYNYSWSHFHSHERRKFDDMLFLQWEIDLCSSFVKKKKKKKVKIVILSLFSQVNVETWDSWKYQKVLVHQLFLIYFLMNIHVFRKKKISFLFLILNGYFSFYHPFLLENNI